MSSSDPSITSPTIPQIAAALLVGYFVYRYFFSSPESASPDAASRPPVVDPVRLVQQVDAVNGMFPQFSRAAVEAELIRNGGSIEIATDRILSNGFLPEPPNLPRPPADSSASTQSSSLISAPSPATRSPGPAIRRAIPGSRSTIQIGHSDLVTRYNLHRRLDESEADTLMDGKGKGKAPATKDGRTMVHKEKRDAMIIEARRRVEKMAVAGKI